MAELKLQIVCFLITSFVFARYTRLSKIFATTPSSTAFLRLLYIAVIETILDMATAYTVNDPEVLPWINNVLHWLFFVSIDTLLYFAYLYFLASLPEGNTHTRDRKVVNILYVVNMIVVTITMPFVQYITGETTNYSMGLPVYACFLMALFYVILLGSKLITHWDRVSGSQKSNAITIVLVLAIVTVVQYVFPESLVTALVSAFISVSAYINHEDPIRYQFKIDKDSIQEELDAINKALAKNEEVKKRKQLGNIEQQDDKTSTILELSGTTQEMLTVNYMDFLYAESLGNYVNVYILKDGAIVAKQLRQTMKGLDRSVGKYPRLVRVHRAYIVNLDKVKKIDGNSQGYQLLLDGVKDTVPVSRSYIENFNKALA